MSSRAGSYHPWLRWCGCVGRDLRCCWVLGVAAFVRWLQNQLASWEGATGLHMVNRDRHGNAKSITLEGWTALAGMAALVVLIIWSIA